MKLISIIILLGFFGIAIFGYLGMINGILLAYEECVPSLLNNTVCPAGHNTIAHSVMRLNIYKSFSESIILATILSSLLLLLFGAIYVLKIFYIMTHISIVRGRLYALRQLIFFNFFRIHQHIYWLSLHEKRDAALA